MPITHDTAVPFIAWAVTRERVRAGKLPIKVAIAKVNTFAPDAAGVRKVSSCETAGGRLYWPDGLYATEREAHEATEETAAVELRHETAKFNAIKERLTAAFFTAGKRVAELADSTTTRTE